MGDEVEEGFGPRPASDSVALVGALEDVEGREDVQVALDFVGADVPLGSALHSEALVQQRSVYALDEADGFKVGLDRVDARTAAERVCRPFLQTHDRAWSNEPLLGAEP